MSDSCSSFGSLEREYNLGLHVGAVFIILFVSGTACAFPLLVDRIPQLRIPSNFLFFVRHFGTGVLLATAFVHLLPTAFVSLTDPCLPAFWNQKYPAMAGAIAMAGVFAIVVIEMVFSPGRSMCAFPENAGRNEVDMERYAEQDDLERGDKRLASYSGPGADGLSKNSTIELSDAITPASSADKAQHQNISAPNSTAHPRLTSAEVTEQHSKDPSDSSTCSRTPSLTPSQRYKKETLQCVLLEMGILFHSIFIGMALSVAIGNDFVVLLIAITFHQTFEGLALGSRIASVSFPRNAYQPWLMALAYGTTTPIGQAIGLAMHEAYDPQSATGLILVGVMNAISSGLLTYASLVELMAEDFLSDHSWKVLRGRRRVGACMLVFGGAVGMALVGAWA